MKSSFHPVGFPTKSRTTQRVTAIRKTKATVPSFHLKEDFIEILLIEMSLP